MTASHGVVPDRAARMTRSGLAPVGRALARAGVSANAVTALGVLLVLAGSALLAAQQPLAALVVLLAGSLADTLDGAVARASGAGTRLGAFLDSTVDRIADASLFAAAAAVGSVPVFTAAVAAVAILATITLAQRAALVVRTLSREP